MGSRVPQDVELQFRYCCGKCDELLTEPCEIPGWDGPMDTVWCLDCRIRWISGAIISEPIPTAELRLIRRLIRRDGDVPNPPGV